MGRADAVITHCEAGRRELLARFPRPGPVAVIPHGHYRDVYRATVGREEARMQLDLPLDSYVYLALGNIAAYKGLDNLLAAFQQAAAPSDRLLIAGRNRDNRLVQMLIHAAAHDGRVRVQVGEIPEADMGLYLTAADVMVAPFESILTSGSVIAALSLDRPVIVPALGCLPELVTPDAGIVYDPAGPAALVQALQAIKQRDPAALSAGARRVADGLGWDNIARRTAAVYRSCLEQSR
jgi:glycosyltransferase involved in cell wall biosynthesis